MDMKDTLCRQSKETRCYIMAAVMVFEGYKGIDEMTEIEGEMKLDVLGLSKDDIERFPMPKDFSQIVTHLRPISDPEVRHWIICNTYTPVLQSRRKDALRDFKSFCTALGWNANEIKEEMKLTEELLDIKPLVNGMRAKSQSGSGCLSIIVFVIICTTLVAFTFL